MSQRINLAVFGTGRAGHIHISNVLANRRVHLKYLVDVDMDLLEAVKTKFGLNDTQLVLDSKSDIVFDDSSVGGVVVASTTHTHESIVKSAIEKGKLNMTDCICIEEFRNFLKNSNFNFLVKLRNNRLRN